MAITSLPCLVEKNFQAYLSGGDFDYPVFKSFSAAEFTLPAVLVRAGRFTETENGTHVYNGEFAVSVISNIDIEPETVLETHDEVVSEVYSMMIGASCIPPFNESENGHLHNIKISSYDQDREERSLITILLYEIDVQTLGI